MRTKRPLLALIGLVALTAGISPAASCARRREPVSNERRKLRSQNGE